MRTYCLAQETIFNITHFLPSSTQWTVACRAPLYMWFPRQEHWSGLPFPPPGDLPDPGIKPVSLVSPALAGGFFPAVPSGKPSISCNTIYNGKNVKNLKRNIQYVCVCVCVCIYIYIYIYIYKLSLCIVHLKLTWYLNQLWKWKLLSHVWFFATMDNSLPGSSAHVILQSRILEWVGVPFSRGPSWCRNRNQVSQLFFSKKIHKGESWGRNNSRDRRNKTKYSIWNLTGSCIRKKKKSCCTWQF